MELRRRAEEETERRWRAEEEERRRSSPFLETWNTMYLLGRGVFGDVHEVLTDKGIQCAVKTTRLPVSLGDQQGSRDIVDTQRFLCRLIHRNIVNFLWTIEQESNVILFMEYLDGVSLENMISGRGLNEDKIARFASQICSALSYMHSLDPPVIHRDINGKNIMVLADGNRVKLIGFDLSMELRLETHDSDSSFTPHGTFRFMAPELFETEGDYCIMYSRESDVWAFGCTVHQMASGSVPYSDYTNQRAFPALLQKKGAPDLQAGCSKELKDFYGCCVAKDRKARKSSADLLSHRFLSTKKA